MRRAQMEMVGLVFIVIVLVIGVVLYLRFSLPQATGPGQVRVQGVTSFLVTLKETTVPACGTSFERVVTACLQDETLCSDRDPCGQAQRTMESLAGAMLPRQGYRYNLSVRGTDLMAVDECESADPSVDLLAAPRVPIVYAGQAQEQLILAICI